MWWVVWVSIKDNKLHHCRGWDESTATKTASLLVEKYGIRRADNHNLVSSLSVLAQTVQDGVDIYRDLETDNPFHFAVQAWALKAKTSGKAVKKAERAWAMTQLGEGDEIDSSA